MAGRLLRNKGLFRLRMALQTDAWVCVDLRGTKGAIKWNNSQLGGMRERKHRRIRKFHTFFPGKIFIQKKTAQGGNDGRSKPPGASGCSPLGVREHAPRRDAGARCGAGSSFFAASSLLKIRYPDLGVLAVLIRRRRPPH